MSCAPSCADADLSDAVDTQSTPHLFNLPLEIRREIYSYVYKPTQVINVAVCTAVRRNTGRRHQTRIPQPSAERVTLEDLTALPQLQLYGVCQPIRDDLEDHLSRLQLEFHCLDCFDQFLQHWTTKFRTGPSWMRHILIHINTDNRYLSQRLGISTVLIQGRPVEPNIQALHARTLKEAVQVVRQTAKLYLGTRSLPAIRRMAGMNRTSSGCSVAPAPVMDPWNWSYTPLKRSRRKQQGLNTALGSGPDDYYDENEWIITGKLRRHSSELQAHL